MDSEVSITADHMCILIGAASRESGSATTPQPKYLMAPENKSQPLRGSVGKRKESEGVSTGGHGSDLCADRAVGGSGARDNRCLVGHRSNMTGLIRDDDLSPLKKVGERYSIDGKIVQVTVIRDKHYSDLDVYMEDLRNKLISTFTDISADLVHEGFSVCESQADVFTIPLLHHIIMKPSLKQANDYSRF